MIEHGYARRYRKLVFAEQMRSNPTPPERLFWEHRALLGRRLTRQSVLFGWIADFFVPGLRTIIEIDGRAHAQQWEADRRRDRCFEDRCYSILRIEAALCLHEPRLAVQVAGFFLEDLADRKLEHGNRYHRSASLTETGVLTEFDVFDSVTWHCFSLDDGNWDFHRDDDPWENCPCTGESH